MPRRLPGSHSRAFTLLLGLGAGLLVLYIVLYPEQAFRSSLNGLSLWWKLVFPALMPFLMLTEMLTGFGVVHAVGVLLHPLLRLLFRLPGAGGWALAAGLFGGYPAGADATARLHERGLIGSHDAERLFAVSHICNPVTMITIVGVGLLRSPQAGLLIALIHYLSALVAAIPLALAGTTSALEQAEARKAARFPAGRNRSLFRSAATAMTDARSQDGRSFGKLLGDAVLSSIQTLLQLGGFIMLFSVFHQVIRGLMPFIARTPFGDAILSGMLEPHIGAGGFAELSIPLVWQAAFIGAFLGWSGLAQHTQVLSLTRLRNIRFTPFLLTRCLHAVSAFALTLLLWKPLNQLIPYFRTFHTAHAMAGSGLSEHFPLGSYVTAVESVLPLWLFLLIFVILMSLLSRLLLRRRR